MVRGRELPIDTGASALEMAQTIFGDGVTVTRASFRGDNDSSGVYSDGDRLSPGVTPSDTGVILSTGDADDFTTRNNSQSNTATNTSTNTSGVNDDPQFNAVAGARTFDAAILEVDFIPTGDLMTMQFVFSSEEFPEFQNGIYQDFVGVWVNGQRVEMSVGDGDADPNNLNAASNQNLYVDNTADQFNTEMDGFTLTLSLKMPVNAGQENSIRIGIADVSDSNYDSNLLIAADSVQTTVVALDDTVDIAPGESRVLDVLGNDIRPDGATLTVTHINGIAVAAGDTVALATGQLVTLNADGTFLIEADLDEETINFTYTVDSDPGASDSAFVTVVQVPCFVAGTMIATENGLLPVERLLPGMRIRTADDGAQPLLWIGGREVAATGDQAPVEIAAGTFGRHGRLRVSPQHCVLLRDPRLALLFGVDEALVPARHLIDGHRVRRVEGGSVRYVHLLFERHQIVTGNGLESESFLPGARASEILDAASLSEIRALCPWIDPATGAGYGPPARRVLNRFETLALTGSRAAA